MNYPFSPVTTLRPPLAAGDEEKVLVSDPLSGRRGLVDKRTLVRRILSGAITQRSDDPIPGQTDPVTLERLRHWWRRGWDRSLDYYLWSRHARYVDRVDQAGDIRARVLSAYSLEQPVPARLGHVGRRITLPAPDCIQPASQAFDALLLRRTTRRFDTRFSASIEQCSAVMWHGFSKLRATRLAAASPNELAPLQSHGVAFDVFLVSYRAESLPNGLFGYDIENHLLVEINVGDFRDEVSRFIQGQPAPLTASWTIVLVADFLQYQWRYRHERALRNLYIEVGRIAQHVLIAAARFGFGSLVTPAIADSDLSAFLRLETPRQAPMYTITMGPRRAD